MISMKFVNGESYTESYSIFGESTDYINSLTEEVENDYTSLMNHKEKLLIEASIMGENSADELALYESEGKNVFAKIGDAILKIIESFKTMVDKVLDKIKEASFSKKSNADKLEALIKKHPELKDEVISAANSGSLELSDMKSLKELDKTFDEIMTMSKQKDVDPKSLKAKWEKAVKSLEDNSGKVAAVGTSMALIAAGVTLSLNLRTYKSKVAKAHSDIRSDKEAQLERWQRAYNLLNSQGSIDNDAGIHALRLQMIRQAEGKHQEAIGQNLRAIERVENIFANTLDRLTRNASTAAATNFKNNMEYTTRYPVNPQTHHNH